MLQPGERLAILIDEAGLNQRRLSELTGFSQSTVSRHTRGESAIGPSDLARYAKALKVNPEELKRRLLSPPEIEPPSVRAGPADGPESQRFPQMPGSELIVEGQSMAPYLNDGDRLLLRAAEWGEQPSPGESVVVWLEGKGQAVYAWLPLPSGKVRLLKHNPAHSRETIDVDPSDIQRLLRVVRVVRRV